MLLGGPLDSALMIRKNEVFTLLIFKKDVKRMMRSKKAAGRCLAPLGTFVLILQLVAGNH